MAQTWGDISADEMYCMLLLNINMQINYLYITSNIYLFIH